MIPFTIRYEAGRVGGIGGGGVRCGVEACLGFSKSMFSVSE